MNPFWHQIRSTYHFCLPMLNDIFKLLCIVRVQLCLPDHSLLSIYKLVKHTIHIIFHEPTLNNDHKFIYRFSDDYDEYEHDNDDSIK